MNIMVMAADIIRFLKKRGSFVLAALLMEDFLKKDKRRTPDMFINSVTFLFALGYIEQENSRLRLDESAIHRVEQLSFEMPPYA
ncbi:hypothetical protein [Propionivibrio sp.]|uniref:hypothetical protein n=1 Tax=Propionivibrio sp. TaxID=2212460 RepID=UPI0039E3B44F